ncbi:MAG: hypothetical protein LC641_13175, partial [Spirochaeta sp.]|nr:hypothetical protein [Spirochaeta sp.]
NEARFVIKVYDSTVGGGTEADQLADAVLIGMNIDNIDDVAPEIAAAPFGQQFSASASAAPQVPEAVSEYADNLVTSGTGFSLQRHGYVQYAEHSTWVGSTPGASDVSGKVIFLGRTTDNQRVSRVTAQIPGFDGGEGVGIEFDIATWSGSGVTAPANRAISDVATGTTDWGFELVPDSQFITEVDGHVFNFRFAWNSAAIENVAQLNVPVVFRAYDFGPDDGNDAVDDITVDVVPYIARVLNPLGQGGLSSDVIRSATGAYSVEQHPTRVFRAEGFNLDGAVAHLSPGSISTQPATLNLGVSGTTPTSVDVSKDFNASGYLTLFVNGIASLNNLNDDSEPYNQEATMADPRSSRWTDNRMLQNWELTTVLPGEANQTFYYPSMVMDGNQPLFSYANDNNGYTYRTTGDNTSAWRSGIYYERHTAMARTEGGQNWILSVQDAFSGDPIGYLYLNRDRQAGALLGGNARNDDRHFEIIGVDFDSRQLNRFRYPKLHVDGPDNNTNIYVTYYDAHPNRRDLTFVSFRATDAQNSNLQQPANDSSRATQVRVIPNTAGAASEYYDMVKVGANEIAVVYFDEAAGVLRMQYSSNPWDATNLTNTTSTWTEMVIDDSQLTGSHVAMTLGERGGNTYLYIAYHDAANTSLKFAEVNWATKAVTRVTVDSRFSVGTRANVHTIDGLPYVSYFSDSYAGTRNSLRLAYPIAHEGRSAAENIAMDGVSESGEYTGNWEVVAIPANSVPRGGIEQFNRTQINQYTESGQVLPLVGWLADRLEYARFRPLVVE